MGQSILLVASKGMQDPRFRETVILVTRHGRHLVTIGVILNRATEASLASMFPDSKAAAEHRLFFGGPVGLDQMVFLVQDDVAPEGAIGLGDRLFLSSNSDSLRKLVEAPMPATRLRVFEGFSRWARGQLEHEIARGDWHVQKVDAEFLLNEPLDTLWSKLWRRATQKNVRAPGQQFASAKSTEQRQASEVH